MGGRAAARRHARRDAVRLRATARLTRCREEALPSPCRHPGLLHPDRELVHFAVRLLGFEAKHVLAVQLLCDPREGVPELARLLQLEVAAAGLVRELSQRAVRFTA